MSGHRQVEKRPTVETLEGRMLTATVGGVLAPPTVEVGQLDGGSTIAKVRVQDISFVTKVNKSSP
jgi:hypothetical protein